MRNVATKYRFSPILSHVAGITNKQFSITREVTQLSHKSKKQQKKKKKINVEKKKTYKKIIHKEIQSKMCVELWRVKKINEKENAESERDEISESEQTEW